MCGDCPASIEREGAVEHGSQGPCGDIAEDDVERRCQRVVILVAQMQKMDAIGQLAAGLAQVLLDGRSDLESALVACEIVALPFYYDDKRIPRGLSPIDG